jgi:outer membrane receptor for ferrienterochelin and colicin
VARRVRVDGFADYYYPESHVGVEGYRGAAAMEGGYAQQSWNLAQRLFVSAGSRWDHGAVSPQGSVTVLPTASSRLQAVWGEYTQFPDEQSLFSAYGSRRLLPERSTHVALTLEQRFGALARLRISAYRRRDRDLLFRPWLEARLGPDGAVQGDQFQSPLLNAAAGEAKGVEFFLQRRTANRLTGWVSYALGWARMRDGVSGAHFAADQDQRHTANVYLGYRARPSVHVSVRWTYGSGFPVPGYFRRDDEGWRLARDRNTARLDPYQRTDLRVNKSRAFDRWKLTIYGEVVNILNRANYRFDSYNGYDGSGRAILSFSRMFPVLPSAGIMAEF